MSREAIHAALFALASGVADFKTSSRKVKHWGDCNSADFPAIFQVHKYDTLTYLGSSIPPKTTMMFDLVIYVSTDAHPGVDTPSSVMNPILDALSEALLSTPLDQPQTLGGLVSHCRIGGGNIQTDEGTLGEIAVAIVPIEVVVP